MEHGRILTPPNPPKPPQRPSEPPPLKREEGTTIAPDYPPGLTESPA
jgi:cell division protease FtsH